MKTKNQKIGEMGEHLAVAYLLRKGYKIVEKNFRKPYGEIDIVARIKNILVCVEVKTGSGEFLPQWQMTSHKLKKFKRIIEVYILENKLQEMSIRADVVLINLNLENGGHTLEHIEGVEF